MTAKDEKLKESSNVVWEQDGISADCASDYIWPEGAAVRGNVNLANKDVIDRKEVDKDWHDVTSKLLKAI